MELLKKRLPHLRIRPVIGAFPHQRTASRDRADLSKNKDTLRMRNFVIARNAVRLYVDFGVPTLRPVPLAKKPRADGLSNTDCDFSDDEYDEAPEALKNRGPQATPCYHPVGTHWEQRQRRSEGRRRKVWELAEGPEEAVDRNMWFRPAQYRKYFSEPLRCTASLVYADTHEPVESGHEHGLLYSSQMQSTSGCFYQRSVLGHPVAAHAKFHIPHLSRDHNNRLFKLRITGTGVVDSELFRQVVYSTAFECVSRLETVASASKRKTSAKQSEVASWRASERWKRAKTSAEA